jgi:RHS repeat-associated protein
MPTVTHSYDLAGRLTGVSTSTVSGDPGSGSFVNSFDTAGRFYREQYPDGKQVTFQLDANGNITRMTYPDGYYVERFYDELNRLTAIKLNGSTTEEVSITYDALSRRATMSFANGTSTEYEFAVNNDLTGLSHSFVGSSLDADYQFNDAHQLMSQMVSDDQFMWHPPSAVTTTYGAANNINQYPTVGAATYTYNNNGCLTGDGVWTFGYDVQNRLTSAAKSGVSASYLYDPLNRQSQKDVGGTKTRFIYNGAQRIAEYNGTSGSLITRFVYAKGLDEPVVEVTSAGTKSYFHRDRQGSIIAKTDNTGAVTQRNEYGPFGESSALSGISFGYTGQRYDSESGLYFYKTRYYSPVIGRFLQPDTISYGDGLNMYAYVNNQPMDTVDLLGTGGDEPTDDPTTYTGSYSSNSAGLRILSASDLNGDTEPFVPYLPGLRGAFGSADAAADFDYESAGVGFGVGISSGPAGRGLSFAGISTPSFGVSRAPSQVGRFGLAASNTTNLGTASTQPTRHGISMIGSLGAPATDSGSGQGSGFGRSVGPGLATLVGSPTATANGFGIGLLPSLGRSASPSNDVVGPTLQGVRAFG